ncbi:MAG: glycosyltransferase family 2 protein [Candidatus Geothermincolia bacterium]
MRMRKTGDRSSSRLDPQPKKLSVIMAAHNEELTIREAVEATLDANVSPLELELIVVDDGSNDRTPEIIRDFEGHERVISLIHEENHGKGRGIRTGLGRVTGDIVLIEDADLELDPKEYPKLIAPILADEADVVFGSRFRGKVENMRWFSKLGNRVLSLVASLLFWCWITDEATGYKVFRTDVIKSFNLQCEGFDFCPEATAKTIMGGYRLTEVPVDYNGRSVAEGKKVRLRDGYHAAKVLVKYRLAKVDTWKQS